jgi:hypothetical protein
MSHIWCHASAPWVRWVKTWGFQNFFRISQWRVRRCGPVFVGHRVPKYGAIKVFCNRSRASNSFYWTKLPITWCGRVLGAPGCGAPMLWWYIMSCLSWGRPGVELAWCLPMSTAARASARLSRPSLRPLKRSPWRSKDRCFVVTTASWNQAWKYL